jgi:predicted nuclease of restriction endonuclease-like (RecB) superfamily
MENTIQPFPLASYLFTRIATILDAARERVVRKVNQETVTAYWLIGREIVVALQSGESRAAYGKKVIPELSEKLVSHYGTGFSATNLEYFRKFYLAFPSPASQISHPVGGKSFQDRHALDEERSLTLISRPVGEELIEPQFHPQLSWSHYRAIMRVDNPAARTYYERESAACNWSKRDLERQIATQYYERIMSSSDKQSLIESTAKTIRPLRPIDVLKDPMILEFLNLPDSASLHESDLETAIVSDIQRFLLELGKGFSFVGRQQRLRFDDQDFYVDLVFYNYLLRCFVLVDLKIGDLTHQDIGQMDGYVRMYDEQHKTEGHNPTLGLVLCSQKNAAVARYSVLQGSQQLFASKYLMVLPTEEQLSREIERQRSLIEDRISARKDMQ